MSNAGHYTDWPKEDKDALAHQRMEEMRIKNEEIKRRYAEVEADRKQAEQQNSSVTLIIKGRSPSPDRRFEGDSSNARGIRRVNSREDSRRGNSQSKDFQGSKQGADFRRTNEQEFSRGSHVTQTETDYEKWKADRVKIDQERIARHKVKREWDEDKIEQDSEQKPLPSKFYKDPSWVSRQDDQQQRRDFGQRGYHRGSNRGYNRGSRQNYENEDSDRYDRPGRFFNRSRNNSSADRQFRTSLSDDEDNRQSSSHQKYESQNDNSSSFRRSQESSRSFNSRSRGRGGPYQRGRGEHRFSETRSNNPPEKSFDIRNNNRETGFENKFRENENRSLKQVRKQSSGAWSDDDNDNSATNNSSFSQIGSVPASKPAPKHTWSTWEDADSANAKVEPQQSTNKSNISSSRAKQTTDGWADDDNVTNTKVILQSSTQTKKPDADSKNSASSGIWSDVEDDVKEKPKNDDAWLDDSHKTRSPDKIRRRTEPPKVYLAGRGRKWSFEPQRFNSMETSNTTTGDCSARRDDGRSIRMRDDHSLTVTVNNSGGTGNSTVFSRTPRNADAFSERNPKVLSRSFSDADKPNVSHDPSIHQTRFDDAHRYPHNARNFRFRGGGLSRDVGRQNSFPKSDVENVYPQNREYRFRSSQNDQYSVYDAKRNDRFKDNSYGEPRRGGGGNFRRGESRDFRRPGGTRRFADQRNMSQKSSRHEHDQEQQEGWGDADKSSRDAVHPEDVWGDSESGSADIDKGWLEDGNACQPLKPDKRANDGWESEGLNQVSENKDGNKDRNLSSKLAFSDASEKDLNASHDHVSNPECAGDASRDDDDDSWKTTSDEEEIGGGEYIDDEGLDISNVPPYDREDTSSSEMPNFVCSWKQFQNLSKTAGNEVEVSNAYSADEPPCTANSKSLSFQESSEMVESSSTSCCEFKGQMETSCEMDSSDAKTDTNSEMDPSNAKTEIQELQLADQNLQKVSVESENLVCSKVFNADKCESVLSSEETLPEAHLLEVACEDCYSVSAEGGKGGECLGDQTTSLFSPECEAGDETRSSEVSAVATDSKIAEAGNENTLSPAVSGKVSVSETCPTPTFPSSEGTSDQEIYVPHLEPKSLIRKYMYLTWNQDTVLQKDSCGSNSENDSTCSKASCDGFNSNDISFGNDSPSLVKTSLCEAAVVQDTKNGAVSENLDSGPSLGNSCSAHNSGNPGGEVCDASSELKISDDACEPHDTGASVDAGGSSKGSDVAKHCDAPLDELRDC